MSSIRVLLAEDHPKMAEQLRGILETDFEVVASVGDGRSMVEAASKFEPDIIVADVSMPFLSGLEAARQVKKLGLYSKIIFVTMYGDVALAQEAFRAGASGYLLKQGAARELLIAMREVMEGNYYVTPLITDDPAAFLGALGIQCKSLPVRCRTREA